MRDKAWSGKKNGELLSLVSESKFDLFVTITSVCTIDETVLRKGRVSAQPFFFVARI
jgi:hypothetical protein